MNGQAPGGGHFSILFGAPSKPEGPSAAAQPVFFVTTVTLRPLRFGHVTAFNCITLLLVRKRKRRRTHGLSL